MNFKKSEGKVRFEQIFFWKWSSRRAEKDDTKQKVLSFQEICQKRKLVIKIEFTHLSLSDCKNVPFKRGLKSFIMSDHASATLQL